MESIKDVKVAGRRIFLRVDFNVPIVDGKIEDNNRIKAALPTINYLREHKARIIIGTHVGRPNGEKTEETSVLPIVKNLSTLLNADVFYINDVLGPKVERAVEQLKDGDVLVLGNLRWHSEEEQNNPEFASKLASYADLYVNDAFAVSHRANASVEAITKFLPSYSGFLLEREVTTLRLLFDFPVSPFVAIIGGAKVKDKAGIIKKLVEKADSILVGGAVANTFLLAKGENVGNSLVEPEMVDECRRMIQTSDNKIILPIDSVKAEDEQTFKIMDIGPETVAKYQGIISEANSIFFNGNLGQTEDERYQSGTSGIAKAINESQSGVKVAAGGDTVGFINDNGLAAGFSFLSTGGGAALEFLAGGKLPGIEALE